MWGFTKEVAICSNAQGHTDCAEQEEMELS